jgi:hypothetical protein
MNQMHYHLNNNSYISISIINVINILPMVVTLVGILMDAKDEHWKNEAEPYNKYDNNYVIIIIIIIIIINNNMTVISIAEIIKRT